MAFDAAHTNTPDLVVYDNGDFAVRMNSPAGRAFKAACAARAAEANRAREAIQARRNALPSLEQQAADLQAAADRDPVLAKFMGARG